jgi:hypothetical protein
VQSLICRTHFFYYWGLMIILHATCLCKYFFHVPVNFDWIYLWLISNFIKFPVSIFIFYCIALYSNYCYESLCLNINNKLFWKLFLNSRTRQKPPKRYFIDHNITLNNTWHKLVVENWLATIANYNRWRNKIYCTLCPNNTLTLTLSKFDENCNIPNYNV